GILKAAAPLFKAAPLESAPRDLLVVTRHVEIAAWCRENSVRVLLHDLPERNQAIRLALAALNCAGTESVSDIHAAPEKLSPEKLYAEQLPDGCLFCPADQPLVTEESLHRIIKAFQEAPDRIIRLSYHGTEGSPVLFPASLFPELITLPAGTGGREVIRRHPELVTAVEAQFPEELKDADTPEALRELEGDTPEVLPELEDDVPFHVAKAPHEQNDLRFTIPDRRFTLAVRTAAILIHEGRVLLERTIGKNEYYLPGGHVQPLEKTDETLIRELREELHSEMEITGFAGVGELFFPWEGRIIQQLCFYYRVRFRTEKAAPGIPAEGRFDGFDPAETKHYHLEYVWVPLEQLDRIRIRPGNILPLLVRDENAPPRRFVWVQPETEE
ncbi:MAG: NTP transferase domain-containing protein, partial [Stomatobaculum sp.]|nr:NTP transferase domain-containing protein [Stomatobaculum sp.]